MFINERLQQEARAVLNVIENTDVAQALKQDKTHNLQYLKDNYHLIPLRDAIDARGTSASAGQGDGARARLHLRTWLAHWSLFVYFNDPAGRTLLLETFLAPTYLATIQTATRTRSRGSCTYLYVDFDFQAAQKELSAAEGVVKGDFLGGFVSEWVESAHGLVSEVYVRIHQCINIG
ncbi:hypothetical protein HWV62_21300 [Athelia sp. TMB]|nr:hypothetical protein HWV62_21300 [Athelia sp. TMB]